LNKNVTNAVKFNISLPTCVWCCI